MVASLNPTHRGTDQMGGIKRRRNDSPMSGIMSWPSSVGSFFCVCLRIRRRGGPGVVSCYRFKFDVVI